MFQRVVRGGAGRCTQVPRSVHWYMQVHVKVFVEENV